MRQRLNAVSLFLFAVLAAPVVAQTATVPQPPAQPPGQTTQTSAPRPGPTPEMFWQALVTGNKEFIKGKLEFKDLARERELLIPGQYPPMSILSCSDSRVPPELAFNQSLGALFVVRSAGNVADTLSLASLEFAITKKWTMLIVVLAHEDCGAIEASMGLGDPESPNLLALATRIRGSFWGIDWDPNDEEAVRKATIANAKHSAAALLAQSAIIRNAVASGTLRIIVAYYSMKTGEVTRVE